MEFEFLVIYCDRKGHFFRTCLHRRHARVVGTILSGNPGERTTTVVPNMTDVVAALRGLRDNGDLPGLNWTSERPFDGIIMVTHPQAAVPGLLLPPDMK